MHGGNAGVFPGMCEVMLGHSRTNFFHVNSYFHVIIKYPRSFTEERDIKITFKKK